MTAAIVARRLALVAAVVGLVALGAAVDLDATFAALSGWAGWINEQGAVGLLAFVGAFVGWGMVLPKGPFVLLAGFVYGVGPGLAVAYAASTVAIAGGFWVARTLARDRAAAWVARRPWLAACDEALERQGGRIVFLLRMSPILPSQAQNYLYGLSRVRFPTCLVASWLGMLPCTALFVVVGATVGAPGVGGISERLGWTLPIGLVLGALAILVVARHARRSLRAAGIVAAPTGAVARDAA